MTNYKIIILLLISLLLSIPVPVFAEASIVSTYGGTDFYLPCSIAWDKDGGMIVVDSYNHLIRKIKDEKVLTIAGSIKDKDSSGSPIGGYADGDALKARFNNPRYAVADSKGNIFVSDTGNHVIRKISAGKVYTLAGNGKPGFLDQTGIKAQFNVPTGIAVDKNDNLYVSDSLNHVIRKITPNGVVTTFAGTQSKEGGYKDGQAATAVFNEPAGLAFDKSGILYVLDSGNQMVRKIEKGIVSTVAGTGGDNISDTAYIQGGFVDGMSAKFNFPKGIDIAEDGTIFIADTWNNAIRAIKPNKEVVTIAGSGVSGNLDGSVFGAQFNTPTDVKFKSGNLYITDMWNNSIRIMPVQLDHLTSISDKSYLTQGIEYLPKSNQIQVWVDKKLIVFPDTQPFIDKGKTFVPIRFICESWGAKVDWNNEKHQAEISKNNITKIFRANSESISMKESRTLIHIRALAEGMGFYVQWVPEYNAVVISTGK